ncbi:hypothetical protein Q8791_28490 [Nocardiopsis sp. CT-R113]|uniref:TIGR04086 family membrane protein n=1 Tax=Nocardiopsis codii TaxID=3065942 RepID=A0ABU7KG28_9ACTN|nr:hypothetical protein [Nocardiopsis sp. CT-R113]MEE2041168.1 hypothetical protein [Nocardiopsis sp. CT-R113]
MSAPRTLEGGLVDGLAVLLVIIGGGYLVYNFDGILEMLEDPRWLINLAGLLALVCLALMALLVLGSVIGELDDDERGDLGGLLLLCGVAYFACFGLNHLIELDDHSPPRGGGGGGAGYDGRSSGSGWGDGDGDGGDGGGD